MPMPPLMPLSTGAARREDAVSPSPLHAGLRGARVAVVNWRDLDHSMAGGAEHYAWECARALREAGAEVEFVTARDTGQSRRDERDGITIRRGGGTFGYYAFAASRLLRRRRELDLVIDPECGIPTFSPLWLPRSTPVVLVVHHVHQEQFATYLPRALARFGQWLEAVAMPRIYRRAVVVAVSASTRNALQEQLDWHPPIQILANGATIPQRLPEARFPTGGARLVALGRLVAHKRVDLVVRALDALRAEHPDISLDVCGRGPEQETLQQLVDELGLGDRVRLHGFLAEEDKQALLASSTLHVCASDAEGWGQVVIEAAGLGLPTVARDVPGLRDSIRDGSTGWLVPEPGDGSGDQDQDQVLAGLVTTIRSALLTLDDADHGVAIREQCHAWAAGFTWRDMHDQVRDLAAALLPDPTSSTSTTTTSTTITTRFPGARGSEPEAAPSGASRSER